MINSSCSTANENCMAVKNEVHSGSDKGCPQKDAPGKKKEKSYVIFIQAGERFPFSLMEPSCLNRILRADYEVILV